jgi:hypothetical protein
LTNARILPSQSATGVAHSKAPAAQ